MAFDLSTARAVEDQPPTSSPTNPRISPREQRVRDTDRVGLLQREISFETENLNKATDPIQRTRHEQNIAEINKELRNAGVMVAEAPAAPPPTARPKFDMSTAKPVGEEPAPVAAPKAAPKSTPKATFGDVKSGNSGIVHPTAAELERASRPAQMDPMQPKRQTQPVAQPGYGNRTDGTPKGTGYFGELKRPDGKVSTELSVDVNLDGKNLEIPLIVPTLTRQELDHLLKDGEPTEAILRKAVDHARGRISAVKSPYAGAGEQSAPPPAIARNLTAEEAAGARATYMPPEEGRRRGTMRVTGLRDEQGLPPAAVRETPQNPRSVMNNEAIDTAEVTTPLINRRGAPVSPEAYRAARINMDRMTPADRAAAESEQGWEGSVNAAVNREYAGNVVPGTDTRKEARTARIINAGVPVNEAGRQGAMAARYDAPILQDDPGKASPDLIGSEERNRLARLGPVDRGLAKGGLMVGQQVNGIARFISDSIGTDFLSGQLAEQGKGLQRSVDAYGDPENQSFMVKNFEGALTSIVSNAPGLLYGILSGGMGVPLMMMGAQTFGQEYDAGRRAGRDYADATARAGIFGAAEIIGERMGLGNFLRAARGAFGTMPTEQIARELGKSMVRELPGEQLTTLIQFATDAGTPVGLTPEATIEHYLSQVADTFAQTIMQTGIQSGGVMAVAKGREAMRSQSPARGSDEDLSNIMGDQRPLAEIRAEQDAQDAAEAAARVRNAPPPAEPPTDGPSAPPPPQPPQTPPPAPAGITPDQNAESDFQAGLDELGSIFGAPAATNIPENIPSGQGTDIEGEFTREEAPKGDATPKAPIIADTTEHIDQAAARTDHDATPGQIEAGTQRKGVFRFAPEHPLHGLGDIAIETARGEVRTALDGSWQSPPMPAHYGEIKRAQGADGDKLDLFIGESTDAKQVFLIDQIDPKTGKFDEHKAMVGFDGIKAAHDAYLGSYSDADAKKRIGAITVVGLKQFTNWVRNGDTKKAFAYQQPIPEKPAEKPEAPKPTREVIEPAKDRELGANDAGERLYERSDGSRYRIHNGRPDFGGDLVPSTDPVSRFKSLIAISEKQADLKGEIAGRMREILAHMEQGERDQFLSAKLRNLSSDLVRQHAPLSDVVDEIQEALFPKSREKPAVGQYTYHTGKHSKTGAPLHIVRMGGQRVDRDEYLKVKDRAAQYGGKWSKFVKGFLFPSEEKANQFIGVAGKSTAIAVNPTATAVPAVPPSSPTIEAEKRDTPKPIINGSTVTLRDGRIGKIISAFKWEKGEFIPGQGMTTPKVSYSYTLRSKDGKEFTADDSDIQTNWGYSSMTTVMPEDPIQPRPKPATPQVDALPGMTPLGQKPPSLTAQEIPSDMVILLPVKVEETGVVHQVEFNAREAFKEASRKIRRMQDLARCLEL